MHQDSTAALDRTHRQDGVLSALELRVLRGRHDVGVGELVISPGLPGVALVVEDEPTVHGDRGEDHLAERHRGKRGQDGVHLVLLSVRKTTV